MEHRLLKQTRDHQEPKFFWITKWKWAKYVQTNQQENKQENFLHEMVKFCHKDWSLDFIHEEITFVRRSLSARCWTVPPDFSPSAANAWHMQIRNLAKGEIKNKVMT